MICLNFQSIFAEPDLLDEAALARAFGKAPLQQRGPRRAFEGVRLPTSPGLNTTFVTAPEGASGAPAHHGATAQAQYRHAGSGAPPLTAPARASARGPAARPARCSPPRSGRRGRLCSRLQQRQPVPAGRHGRAAAHWSARRGHPVPQRSARPVPGRPAGRPGSRRSKGLCEATRPLRPDTPGGRWSRCSHQGRPDQRQRRLATAAWQQSAPRPPLAPSSGSPVDG